MKRLLPLLLAACTPNFQAQSEVVDLRVLAVQAEPAEAQFDDGGVDDVQVRVLAVDPRADAGTFASMSWNLCAPTDSRRCDRGHFLSGTQGRKGGDEFPVTVISVPQELVDAGLASDKLGGLGGIRIQFSLSVDDGSDAGPAYASKDLLYSKRGTPPNHNPLMTGVDLTHDGVDAGVFAPGQTLCLPVNVQIGVRPQLAPDAREEYDIVDLQNHLIHLVEDPRYDFFSTPGATFDRDTATEPVDGGAPPDGLTRIDASAGQGTFFIVVRDGRGGESWISFPWTTPQGPSPCAAVGARARSVRP